MKLFNQSIAPELRIARIQSYNEEQRTIEVVFSTGARVLRRPFLQEPFIEELSMDPAAVRLDRLNAGAPFLNSHRSNALTDQLGVVESARVENSIGMAVVRLSQRPDVEGIIADLRDGIIRNVSVGYVVHRFEELPEKVDGVRVLRATDWEPMEISAVTIPADANAQVRSDADSLCEFRLQENDQMKKRDVVASEQIAQSTDTAASPAASIDVDAERVAIRQDELQRIKEIRTAVAAARLDDAVASQLIDAGVSIDVARARVLEQLAQRDDATATQNIGPIHISVRDAGVDCRRDGVQSALLHRFDARKYQLSEHGRRYASMSLVEVARQLLRDEGRDVHGMSRIDIAEMALGLRAPHSASDFPILLANVANKTLMDAYAELPQTFAPFVREVGLPDFKTKQISKMGDAPALSAVNDAGEITYGTIGEDKEEYALSSYGKIVSVTRKVIINDDLDAFTRVPQSYGMRARSLESDLVWAQITSNPTLNDGVALFHADHNNLVSSAGTSISVGSIGVMRSQMRNQTTINGEFMEVYPAFLVVPTALETIADQYVTQLTAPDSPANTNPFAGRLRVIAEPRLDANSAIAWYLIAAPAQVDIIELGYLEGQRNPRIATKQGWEVDGLEIRCMHDVAAKVVDYRGLQKNAGASS